MFYTVGISTLIFGKRVMMFKVSAPQLDDSESVLNAL